jgi:hypothetical protein
MERGSCHRARRETFWLRMPGPSGEDRTTVDERWF